ncbi:MAG: L,D-transpeptidase [Mariprofundaceae bacterium]
MIRINIGRQTLAYRSPWGVWQHYAISSAMAGVGNRRDSLQTPLGKHRICEKIGDGLPINTAFVGRIPVGSYRHGVDDPKRDWILSRILWLEGMETTVNRRGAIDTKSRYIYIHGTHDEHHLGIPVSHGCIRMENEDILTLFDQVCVGEGVLITGANAC